MEFKGYFKGRMKRTSSALHYVEHLIRKIPIEIRYTILLFIASRSVLSVIGIIAHSAFRGRQISDLSAFLSMWGVWDSNWYIGIARDGYSTALNSVNMANYAFFPFYPTLMRLLGTLTADYYNAGLIISNACLFLSCLYLFRLVSLENDSDTALRSIKYLVLFPTAFILSGVFSESLFLALVIMAYYYAKKGNWLFVGVLGFFTSLTRPPGVIIIIPLLYEYLKQADFRIENIRFNVLYLLLIPCGISLFAIYNYYLTGDFLAFVHIQSSWGGRIVNPVTELYYRLISSDVHVLFGALFTSACIILLVLYHKKVDFSLWLFATFMILIPLSTPSSSWSMARYMVVVFPLFIILAKVGKDRVIDQAMTIILALFQGFFMAIWTTSYLFII